ncbi:MAG: serine/threonine-protein kinase [Solirubrobacteraceae bacterium]|nr:serine/threonine-protein kinase [Solirubrobacteraceae bacterium]
MKPGDQVAGYRIESVLGRGGMGVVYEATQLSLNRTVALKVMYPHLSQDPVFRARFRREGELQASIDHPSIVTVYEAGEADEGLFIAMRLVRGSTLKDLIAEEDLGGEDAVRLLRPIADALDTAHAAGMTHRDIKPQNILVSARGHAYLADFGLTRSSADRALTKTGQFVGTIDYVSPEQIRGEPAGTASDVYALTAVLYECLCGTVPFPQPSDVAVLNAHMSNPPPRVTSHRPELSPAVDDVIARGMAKEPAERQTSATEMIVQAERAISTPAHGTASLADEGVPETVIRDTTGSREQPAAGTAGPAAPEREPAPAPTPTPGDRGARLGGWKRRVAVAAVLLLALAAGAGLASLAGDSDPPGGAAATPATTSDDDDGERQGNQITMRSVPGTTAVANAGLVDYGEPPPTIRIQLTPGGPRYQLLLFQTLDSVRSVEGVPTTAMVVLGGGPRGDLSTGEKKETGYTRAYGVAMPANFRRFRYFGIVRVTGTKRRLVVYDQVERLTDPR